MAKTTASGLHLDRLPQHVAIIMDGNGRWARQRGLPRIRGHEAGAESVRAVTEEAARLGLRQLTLYAFSSQNWGRPRLEVGGLMRMLRKYLVSERGLLRENDIRFVAIGRREGLPRAVRRELEATEELCRGHRGMTMCLALNYGGREEIADAARSIAADAAAGKLRPARVNEALISSRLYTAGMPDPDLLVRTAGEMRVSNFLLWQISYAELYVTPVCWPDFRVEQFHEALRAYAERKRTFGLVE
ncbi:MAG: di-trans,poly-cis-decaprenylcistransferase [Planctomycetes bacterium]|nr:di-trans,poly-cis-decaprenylcistransferase [Planctomycetota bacterium]